MVDRVQRELLIPASAADVWVTITSDGWLADEVALDLQPGGDASFHFEDRIRAGWVEHASPPGVDGAGSLAFWWAFEGEPATRVELSLEAHGDVTRLRVVETRPLDVLDLVGVPLRSISGPSFGPALLAA